MIQCNRCCVSVALPPRGRCLRGAAFVAAALAQGGTREEARRPGAGLVGGVVVEREEGEARALEASTPREGECNSDASEQHQDSCWRRRRRRRIRRDDGNEVK